MAHSPFARPAYEVQSPRLIIRTAVASDSEAFHNLLTDPKNFPHQEIETDLTLDKLRDRIGRFAESTAQGQDAFMVFILRETDQLIGYGGYNTFEAVQSEQLGETFMTDIGIMIDHRYWRKGYGLEVLSALVEYGRVYLGCQLFRTETDENNEPWRALMRSAGLAATESKDKASYDERIEVWVWKFDTAIWEQAKKKMRLERKWLL